MPNCSLACVLWIINMVLIVGLKVWGSQLFLAIHWFLPASDIVEGMVNKGIFLDGDNGGTFLHFGNYQNSCISDPTFCGPEGECTVAYMQMIVFHSFQFDLKKDVSHLPGITFSFFWKNCENKSRFAVASGGKVISNGFSVYTNPFAGYVEFYTRGNNHRWKTNIQVPGNFLWHNFEHYNI